MTSQVGPLSERDEPSAPDHLVPERISQDWIDGYKAGKAVMKAHMEASRAPVVPPADYKLVPVEPTQAMLAAGEKAELDAWTLGEEPRKCGIAAWAAMLAAAPSVGVPLSDERAALQAAEAVLSAMSPPTNKRDIPEIVKVLAQIRAVLAASLEKK